MQVGQESQGNSLTPVMKSRSGLQLGGKLPAGGHAIKSVGNDNPPACTNFPFLQEAHLCFYCALGLLSVPEPLISHRKAGLPGVSF